MRRIVFVWSFLLIFFLGKEAFAYDGGLLNNRYPINFSNLNANDNNLNTYIQLSANRYVEWELSEPADINAYIFKDNIRPDVIYFYNSNHQQVGYIGTPVNNYSKIDIPIIKNVVYIRVFNSNSSTTASQLVEFDVFASTPPDTQPPENISDLRIINVKTDSFALSWINPTDSDFYGTKIYLDDVLKATLDKSKTSYSFANLDPNTSYTVKVVSFDMSNNNSSGVTTTVKTLPPPDVTNLELFPSTYSILAQWINPTDSGFIGNDLYLDGNFITSLDKDATSYNFTNLNPNTSYTVKVVSKFSGGYSSTGQTATAKTTIPVEDVIDLQADAKYDRVKLSWTRPDIYSEFFSHVKIYRKKLEQKSFWDQLFGATSVSAATTSDGYTPMFETNGTYWTDLTVSPETTYSYKVTSVNTEGNESQGVTIEATTPSEPVPVLNGVSTTQNENGDYVVTWTSPTKGTVKVLIDGKEYTVVDAATQQVVIPKEDMKLNFFGGYDAKLVPVGEFGTEGEAVQVPTVGETKIDFPFSFDDFMQTVISILAWAAPFILLSFVLVFWRPIVEFIKKTLANAKGGRVKQ